MSTRKSSDLLTSNRTLAEHPWYFGHYLNMARHNAFVIINDVIEKFGYDKKEPLKEENLSAGLSGFYKKHCKTADLQQRFSRNLKRKFPYLYCPVPDGNKNYENLDNWNELMGQEVVDVLATALLCLHNLRNQYSHAHESSIPEEYPSIQYLFKYGVEAKLAKRFIELETKDYKHLITDNDKAPDYAYDLQTATGNFTEKGLIFFIFKSPQSCKASYYRNAAYGL